MTMADSIFAQACARAAEGMEIAAVAAAQPGRIALWSKAGSMTFGELNRQSNQLVRRLREAGVGDGDAVALTCGNRMEFAVVTFAAYRAGLRLTPINWHLGADDIHYIIDNCEAKALFLDSGIAGVAHRCAGLPQLRLKVAIGNPLDGYTAWQDILSGVDDSDIADPVRGTTMMYTSGTTGRPKGVLRSQPDPTRAAQMQLMLTQVFHFDPDSGHDRTLATGPFYHAGPFGLCLTTPLTAGIGSVIMDKWDAERMLALIEQYRITHTFCVPTMFTRLLRLPDEIRRRYDTSSLRFIIHGAAPCSVDTKRAMLDWLGPIIWEMFAGTEGPGTVVGPQEWLAKPGTVGKPAPGQVRILDDAGNECLPGHAGRIFMVNPPGSPFKYFKDPDKTQASQRDGYFTAGDIGYLDTDGYLFPTGRSAEVIIAGGVNLYPQEIDDVLARHPAVADVACVGVPNADLGEEVKAIITLHPGQQGDDAQRRSLMDYCAEHLSKQKWPRSIDFVDGLPRSEAGKILRGKLRAEFWKDRDRQI